MSYSNLIADAIGTTDAATVTLVEDLMRGDSPCLDGLSLAEFSTLARRSYRDATEWVACGTIDGFSLADYCRVMGLDCPRLTAMPTRKIAASQGRPRSSQS